MARANKQETNGIPDGIFIGKLKLKSRVVQSPMAGCTDLAFRMIGRSFGMELAFIEMISSEALVRKNSKTFHLMEAGKNDKPLGAQIVGSNPGVMGDSARIMERMGFDIIDINMGCPVPKIVKQGGGAALLVNLDNAGAIIRDVIKKVKHVPVTVKMRIGFKDPSGEEGVKLAQIAESSGASAIFVHGRTRTQGYSGKADWKAIAKVRDAVKIPVFGNGDIVDSKTAIQALKISGCDGVMIGRGSLGNPWIFKEIDAFLKNNETPKPPTIEDKRKALLKHVELELKTEGEKTGLFKSRRIACWYFKNYPRNSEFRKNINQATTPAQMRKLITNFPPET